MVQATSTVVLVVLEKASEVVMAEGTSSRLALL